MEVAVVVSTVTRGCAGTMNILHQRDLEVMYITFTTQYGSTVYIGIAVVFVFSPHIREIQFLLLVSSQFDF